MRISTAILTCGLCLSALAVAPGHSATQGEAPAERPRSEEARARYPQPVRVGDLIGRQVLEDTPQQRVLGRIAAISRSGDGKVSILMDRGGWLGFGARRVALPAEATAVLGAYLVLKDLDAAALAALPEVSADPGRVLAADTTIRIGLARN